jgi:hypothetical protein
VRSAVGRKTPCDIHSKYKTYLSGEFLNTLQGTYEEQLQQLQRKDEIIDERLRQRQILIESEFHDIENTNFDNIVFVSKGKRTGTV